MSLETTHHDIKVAYNTDTDEWGCRDMDLKAKTLSLLKKKMDKVLSVERRIDNLPVVMLGNGYDDYKITRGVATLFDAKGSNYRGPAVWVNIIKGNQTERTKRSQDDVWIDTPENRERLAAIGRQNDVVKAETAKLYEMKSAAKAFTMTQLEVAKLAQKTEIEE